MNDPYPRTQPNIIGNFTHAPDWMTEAVCAQVDPELFFPEKGHYAHTAKRICATCPVINECLNHALEIGYHATGIWGGTTPTERRTMKPRKKSHRLTTDELTEIRNLVTTGASYTVVARRYGVTVQTLYAHFPKASA